LGLLLPQEGFCDGKRDKDELDPWSIFVPFVTFVIKRPSAAREDDFRNIWPGVAEGESMREKKKKPAGDWGGGSGWTCPLHIPLRQNIFLKFRRRRPIPDRRGPKLPGHHGCVSALKKE